MFKAGNSVDPCKILPNFELTQGFTGVLLHARMNKIQSKMKVLECSQHFTFIFHLLKGS